MSRVTEMARAEADEVERENPDEETPDETAEPAPDETAEPAPDETPAVEPPPVLDAKAVRKVELAVDAQRDRLARLVGMENVAHACVLCGGLGFGPEEIPTGTEIRLTPEGLQFRSPDDLPERPDDPGRMRCPSCDGYGQTRTGARPEAQALFPCSDCNGNGWKIKAVDAPPPAAAFTTATGSTAIGNGATYPDDAFGRPWGHQHYGVAPRDIGVSPPAA